MTTTKLSVEAQAVWDTAMAMAVEYGKVENEVIRSPGRFEGEWFPVVYFDAAVQDGFGNPDDDNGETIELSEAEREAFGGDMARVIYSEQGFVSLEIDEFCVSDDERSNGPRR